MHDASTAHNPDNPDSHAASLLTRRAQLSPQRVAVIDETRGGSEEVTFAQLNARANRAAHMLVDELDIEPGDRVAILAHNTLAYLDLFYAVGKIGAVLCPLNWRLTASELAYIVGHAGPKAIFVGPECAPLATDVLDEVPVQHVVALEHQPEGFLHRLPSQGRQTSQQPAIVSKVGKRRLTEFWQDGRI